MDVGTRKKVWRGGAIAALLIGFFTLIGFIKGWTKAREERHNMSEGYLAKIAGDLNKEMPKLVDADTRFDRVAAGPGKKLTFTLTLVRVAAADIDRAKLPAALDGYKKQQCGKEVVREALAKDVAIEYAFLDKEGKPLSEVTMDAGDCN